MSDADLQSKLQQFDEFFSIEHQFNINIRPLEKHEAVSYDHFVANMPLPFKMAAEVMTVDQGALRSIQSLSGVASQLVDYLNHQSHKLDMLVGYILSQQDEPTNRFLGVRFGGGGVIFFSEQPFELQSLLEMKVFLLEENCAIYTAGEVVETTEVEGGYHHKVVFKYIREEDQEVLVRHSLHQQSKQLQALAQKRREKQEQEQSSE
ncbi:PilZ domain-containing protein [Thalassotalea euphylliae]|uniref:PilZ domain-containing protein n=1 Tax=Thalassotalea euphylliae TaxID=1655234 RepID=UPI00362CD3BF